MTEYSVGTGFDAHALEDGVPLVLGGVRIEHPRGLAGSLRRRRPRARAHRRLLGAAGLEDIGALFPSGDPELAGADSLELLAEAWERVRRRTAGSSRTPTSCWSARSRASRHIATRCARRLAGALGVEPERVAVRATTTDGLGFTGRGEGLAAQAVALLRAMKLASSPTPSTRSCAGRCRTSGREFMAHDPVVSGVLAAALRPVYPDFQLWVVDRERGGRRTVGYACSVPVGWNGVPEPRGIDWALTNGVAGDADDAVRDRRRASSRSTVASASPSDPAPAWLRLGAASRTRRADRAGAPDVEGPLSARRDRPLRRLAPRATVSRTTRGYARTSGSVARSSRQRRAR